MSAAGRTRTEASRLTEVDDHLGWALYVIGCVSDGDLTIDTLDRAIERIEAAGHS